MNYGLEVSSRVALHVQHRNPAAPDLGSEPPYDWTIDALCSQVDPEIFFPDKGASTRPAKRVCSACPVRAECLQFAVDHHERFGIYGGLSERERRRLGSAA